MNHKILVMGPAWVGDMVMAQCLFRVIKQQQPHAVIDVLAPAWSLPLLARMPEVSSSTVMPLGHGQLELKKRYQLGKSLREKQYDQFIVLPNSFKSALIGWWADIPKRTGWRGEMRYFLLNDLRILDPARYPLMIERFMALGLPAGAALPKLYPKPELIISRESQTIALAKYQLTVSDKPLLAICPGAEFGPAKRWPEDYYAAVANAKLAEGWDVWILGSPKDKEIAERMMTLTQQRCINLTGRTQLEEAVDLLALARGVLTNDSGLMHIAAALHKPIVALYGPTSSSYTPPLSDSAEVLSLTLDCQPCFQRVCPLKHHRCMLELTPDKVLAIIKNWDQ